MWKSGGRRKRRRRRRRKRRVNDKENERVKEKEREKEINRETFRREEEDKTRERGYINLLLIELGRVREAELVIEFEVHKSKEHLIKLEEGHHHLVVDILHDLEGNGIRRSRRWWRWKRRRKRKKKGRRRTKRRRRG